MKVWPIDPLVAGYFSLEVSEKLPQGSQDAIAITVKVPGAAQGESALSL